MDEVEYGKQKARIKQYDTLENNKRELMDWKTEIEHGIYLIACLSGHRVYESKKFGEDFFERLESNLCDFLDAEISAIDRVMEEI